MILATLDDVFRYANLHPLFAHGLAALRDPESARWPAGRRVLNGDALYLNVERRDAVGRSAAVLEAHRRYIDIQYTVAGNEWIGWRPLPSCTLEKAPYNEGRDVAFYDDPVNAWFPVPAGHLAIFFPEDAHAPLAGDGGLHKLIVKVAVASG